MIKSCKFYTMKYLLLLLFIPSICFSQKKKKGDKEYVLPENNCTTDNPFDEVWGKIIGQLSADGIPIHTIDKGSGVITSVGNSSIEDVDRARKGIVKPGRLWTFQKKGLPENSTAWVMLYNMADNLYPVYITGDINIIVRKDGDKTNVQVTIANLKAESNKSRDKWKYYNVYTTGIFEKSIVDAVK